MATNPYGPQTGLLGLLGAGQNPIYRSLKDGGLLDSLAYGLASGTGLSDGLQKAALAQIGGQNNRQERAAKAAEWDQTQQQQNATRELLAREAPDLAQLLDTGVPMGEVWGEYFRRKSPQGSGELPNSVQEYEYAKANGFGGSYTDWLSGKGGATERSLTPTYLRDENGNIVIGQLDKGGQVTPSKLPDGYSAIDPFTMAGGKTGATVDAKTVAAARAALPGMETSMGIAQKAFELVRNDTEGRKQWFGQAGALPRGMWVQGGSPMANFQTNAGQTLGQAFAQARETLKGGGPITDYEGKAAAAAYSRAESALSQGDEKAFLLAVDDMEAAINAGYQKLLETAQGDPSGGAIGRAGGGEYTVLGVE